MGTYMKVSRLSTLRLRSVVQRHGPLIHLSNAAFVHRLWIKKALCKSVAPLPPGVSPVPPSCRRGMDLYFERHDGHAVTCDDFLAAMADANKTDLKSVGTWYVLTFPPSVFRAYSRHDVKLPL